MATATDLRAARKGGLSASRGRPRRSSARAAFRAAASAILVASLVLPPQAAAVVPESSPETDPDYALVFPCDSVLRIDIVIEPSTWRAMMEDMTALYGEFGGKLPVPGHASSGAPPPPPLPPVPNPAWAEAEVRFGDEVWEHVGVRFKGGSSLAFSWSAGILKLPWKLDFDRFEDEWPETRDRRFHGFGQLTLSSGFMDPSLLRERITADIFREAGVPAPRTAFCRVYVDCGEGPAYFGLYTLVEVVEDTVVGTQLPAGGSVYEPDGLAATFAEGSFDRKSFDLESAGSRNDWSPVLRLYEALHSGERRIHPPLWRAGLEQALDVDRFLTWLAVDVVVQNWDSYGRSPHNYYLCADPVTGRLTWVPWDNNMALGDDTGLFPVLTPDL